MKTSEKYDLYKKWCENKKRPIRSYTAFMHFEEFTKEFKLLNK